MMDNEDEEATETEHVQCPVCNKSTAVLKAQCPHCGESDYKLEDKSESIDDTSDSSDASESIGTSKSNSYQDEGGPEHEGSYDDEDYTELTNVKKNKLRY